MKEGEVNRRLVKALRKELPGAVVFKHADQITAGVPDISVTWRRRTAWVEVKVIRQGKTFQSRGLQDMMMHRLSLAGHAFYVVYYEKTNVTCFEAPTKNEGTTLLGTYEGLPHQAQALTALIEELA